MAEKELQERFHKETGKNAIWHGKITNGYNNWLKKKNKTKDLKKTPKKTSKRKSPINQESTSLKNITNTLEKLMVEFQFIDNRLQKLEQAVFHSFKEQSSQKVSTNQFLRIVNTAYDSIEKKKTGGFVPIQNLTSKIKDYIPWSVQEIHDELYKLFMEFKIDLQPGKSSGGIPLIKEGKTFVWFNLNND